MIQHRKILLSLAVLVFGEPATAQTTALWPFDEQRGLYPSSVLSDVAENNYPMVIGPGAQIVEGRFGNALEAVEPPPVRYPGTGSVRFGLSAPPKAGRRTIEPLTWKNARFCALMTSGEKHLRKEVGFVNPTATRLNLGAFDWTVEFWLMPTQSFAGPGVVFEIGRGPRGENQEITQLLVDPERKSFVFLNEPSGTSLRIPSDVAALTPSGLWRHFAFVYSDAERQLRHYVDGKEQPLPEKASLQALDQKDEDYLSVGRDGLWQKPLAGKIDELRFSVGKVYQGTFRPPGSFVSVSGSQSSEIELRKGPPLLFAGDLEGKLPVLLYGRKHLFLDDSLVQEMESVTFNVNPPRLAERVIDNIQGPFRKHLNVVEDEAGTIRMYYGVANDFLGVRVSQDGVHWQALKLDPEAPQGMQNVVLPEPAAMGMAFIDPNAPPEERWKYLSDYHRRGIFLYSSRDGWSFKRHKTAVLPFRSGSQSNIFYDDQRQLYISYHRSDFGRTPAGKTQREFVLTEARELRKPWSFTPQTQAQVERIAKKKRVKPLIPWYLDNGPLTPGGFGVEYPTVFAPDDALDPVGMSLYVPKAVKYPWAPDVYLAFPLMYFHYEADGTEARWVLGEEERGRGSGPIETQLAVSRDGVHWKRYPRPVYVGIGRHGGDVINQAYMAQGMVRRGSEIWQYYFGEEAYHSSWRRNRKRAVYRVIQRLDGFVSADTPYDKSGRIVTKPLVFKGNHLLLNIDTGATGYAQVGLLDETGRALEGYGVDECVYINGDFVDTEVEWLSAGKDLSGLEGKTVQIVFRSRGTKLYSMQFVER